MDGNSDGVIERGEIKEQLRIRRASVLFKRYDLNGDSALTPPELFAHQDRSDIAKYFGAADADESRTLDEQEFLAYVFSIPAEEARLDRNAGGMFDAQDKDASGNLTKTEFRWTHAMEEL